MLTVLLSGEPLRWGLVARGANLRIKEMEVSKPQPFGFLQRLRYVGMIDLITNNR